jgi:hypothetical protein
MAFPNLIEESIEKIDLELVPYLIQGASRKMTIIGIKFSMTNKSYRGSKYEKRYSVTSILCGRRRYEQIQDISLHLQQKRILQYLRAYWY